jgi:hypothetical protein
VSGIVFIPFIPNTTRGICSDQEPQIFTKADFVNAGGTGNAVHVRIILFNDQDDIIDSVNELVFLGDLP